MRYGGPPWPTIAAKRKLKETEDEFKDWRTRLVKVGERVLREIDEGNVSEEAKRELRQFIGKTKATGIYKE